MYWFYNDYVCFIVLLYLYIMIYDIVCFIIFFNMVLMPHLRKEKTTSEASNHDKIYILSCFKQLKHLKLKRVLKLVKLSTSNYVD